MWGSQGKLLGQKVNPKFFKVDPYTLGNRIPRAFQNLSEFWWNRGVHPWPPYALLRNLFSLKNLPDSGGYAPPLPLYRKNLPNSIWNLPYTPSPYFRVKICQITKYQKFISIYQYSCSMLSAYICPWFLEMNCRYLKSKLSLPLNFPTIAQCQFCSASN